MYTLLKIDVCMYVESVALQCHMCGASISFRINQTKDKASPPSASLPSPVKGWHDSLSGNGDMPRKSRGMRSFVLELYFLALLPSPCRQECFFYMVRSDANAGLINSASEYVEVLASYMQRCHIR